MNSQDFLFLYLIIGVTFLLWYWLSRKQKNPTQLNLKAKDSEPILMEAERVVNDKSDHYIAPPSLDKVGGTKKQDYSKVRFSNLGAPPKSDSRELNIVFNYNGHSWDAYEVLGVPAGALLPEVTQAYQRALKEADPESHEFLHCAFRAIFDRRTL